jgi:hexosaminidase
LAHEYNGSELVLPGVSISDRPLFSYRGTHLDVGRHFFSADSIKRFIDILALHKMNTFHWHLTEDQGWRIEIKKYPRLTEIGAFRPNTVIGRNSGEYDTIPHGGYYTQDQIREIVKYAADRYITIIPEIDMPGHMLAALAAYPDLGCSGKGYEVARQWGVFEDVLCLGNEKSYRFVFEVLDEVMDLFPSKYIHIGGDECPKDEWKKCTHCQAQIRELGLKSDEHFTAEQKFQSHFTLQVEQYLKKHGRALIGWDEILEGGISSSATVMAWRSPEYGYQAARLGNQAILSPNTSCYFDYYQTEEIDGEPLALGGCTTVEQVYSFSPLTNTLADSVKSRILGVQANIWTEYIKTFEHVEYMLLPRLAALSEVAWSRAPKDYPGFLSRLQRMVQHYDQAGYNYGRHIFDIKKEYVRDTYNHTQHIKLSALDNATIRYTIDGTEPDMNSLLYSQPINIDQSMVFMAKAFYSGGAFSKVLKQAFDFNQATLKPVWLNTPSYLDYTFSGAFLLNDGLRGEKNYRSGYWLGYNNEDLSVSIDLLKPSKISKVSLNALVSTADWVFRPTFVQVLSSLDNENFNIVDELVLEPCNGDVFDIETYSLTFEETTARYVKVVAGSLRNMPEWHPAKGRPAFIFVDEVSIY